MENVKRMYLLSCPYDNIKMKTGQRSFILNKMNYSKIAILHVSLEENEKFEDTRKSNQKR